MTVYGVWHRHFISTNGGQLLRSVVLFLTEAAAKAEVDSLAQRIIDQAPRGAAPFPPESDVERVTSFSDYTYCVSALGHYFFVREHELNCGPLDLLARQAE